MPLSPNLQKTAKKYFSLSAEDREIFLVKAYDIENNSYGEIAKEVGTYINRIRRDAQKAGIQPRSKANAQKLALSTGRHSHPTRGKEQSHPVEVEQYHLYGDTEEIRLRYRIHREMAYAGETPQAQGS